jgi:hypothetical protein
MGHMTEEDYFYDSGSYLDRRDFRAYANRIRDLIHTPAMPPLSIADIHRLLGDDARREWTADALDSIKDIEAAGLLPTRYRPLTRLIKGLHKGREERYEITPPKRKEPYFFEEGVK